MAKLDGKKVLADAEQNGHLHRIKSGWKGMMIFSGVLMCLLVITLPLGIWFFVIASKARVGMNDEGFAVRWFTTKGYRWEDIEAFQPMPLNFHVHVAGGGLIGGLIAGAVSGLASAAVAAKTQGVKGPISFKMKGRRGWLQFPAHAVENSGEMAQEMERRTGLTLFPPPPEKPAKG